MATVQERIDPKSPHYDAEFAEMRKQAFGAWEDHKADMKNDPEYRDEVVRRYGRDRLKDAE